MEKNGAIGYDTPRCGGNCGCNCNSVKQATAAPGQLELFPQTEEEANRIDTDLTKLAADAVAKASR